MDPPYLELVIQHRDPQLHYVTADCSWPSGKLPWGQLSKEQLCFRLRLLYIQRKLITKEVLIAKARGEDDAGEAPEKIEAAGKAILCFLLGPFATWP